MPFLEYSLFLYQKQILLHLVYGDFSYSWIKFCNMMFSFSLAAIFSFLVLFTREMVDLWPREQGGYCTWGNSYLNCSKWMILNIDQMYFNNFSGTSNWLRCQGIKYLITYRVAENFGMFTICNEPQKGLEVQFPISSESV